MAGRQPEPVSGKVSDRTSENILLEVTDLTVRLSSGVPAVDRVSFRIRRGECLALVGESGCGKTLTALSLLHSVPVEVGESKAASLKLAGREISNPPGSELREIRGGRISMIFQDPRAALDPLFTVGDQMVETLRSHLPLSRSRAVQQALSALEEAGIAECRRVFRSYPHQLSGGQCQRATIALALSTGPELLIADEPTTALDVTVQRQILDLLIGLGRKKGLAVLLITHNLSVVAQLADRVLIMYAGQIVESAQLEEIFSGALHPYTRALLDCLPALDQPPAEPASIPGTVPQPGEWPSGCRFRPRCAFAAPGCEKEQALEAFGRESGRLARCWRSAGIDFTGSGGGAP